MTVQNRGRRSTFEVSEQQREASNDDLGLGGTVASLPDADVSLSLVSSLLCALFGGSGAPDVTGARHSRTFLLSWSFSC